MAKAVKATSEVSLGRLLRGRAGLRSFIGIQAADELAAQMLNIAIGWYVYSVTHNPMSLAYVGLAQFLPNVGMALLTGHAADRFDRRKVIGLSLGAQSLCIAAFGVWLVMRAPSAMPVYVLLFVVGLARAFASPAMSAMLPQVVSEEEFPRAVAASSSVFQVCTIVGPAIGGLVYAISGPGMFALATALYFFATILSLRLAVGRRAASEQKSGVADESVFAGARYVWSNRLLLALISLDLFAVLLGGVSALLPIYAKDILLVGPMGLGWLRCAPGVGAALVGLVLAHRTIERGVGKLMLACVAGFGFATVVFAISRNFWLSLAALLMCGGFDMVSMVIRHTLVQMSTPDAMRGRVSAVNWVFIGASSGLGDVESGAAAALFGTVPAALLGGLGTLVIVALWSRIFPELRRADKLVAAQANDVCSEPQFAAGN